MCGDSVLHIFRFHHLLKTANVSLRTSTFSINEITENLYGLRIHVLMKCPTAGVKDIFIYLK